MQIGVLMLKEVAAELLKHEVCGEWFWLYTNYVLFQFMFSIEYLCRRVMMTLL